MLAGQQALARGSIFTCAGSLPCTAALVHAFGELIGLAAGALFCHVVCIVTIPVGHGTQCLLMAAGHTPLFLSPLHVNHATDTLIPNLTVEAQLTYAADLSLPHTLPAAAKATHVADVIRLLGLEAVQNRQIGCAWTPRLPGWSSLHAQGIGDAALTALHRIGTHSATRMS